MSDLRTNASGCILDAMRESAVALEAFRVYRDMGPERSTRAAARTLTKSDSLIRRWSAAHNWMERARRHDQELSDASHTAHLEAVSSEERQRWQSEILRTEHEASKELLTAARGALRRLKSTPGLGEIARALDVASKLGRLSSGMVMETAQMEMRHDLSDSIRAALDRVYGQTELSEAKPIEIAPSAPV